MNTLKTLFALLSLPVMVVFRGWVLAAYWSWFIVPQFHCSDLRIPVALGIASLLNLMTADITVKREPSDSITLVLTSLSLSAWAYGMGWLIHLFV